MYIYIYTGLYRFVIFIYIQNIHIVSCSVEAYWVRVVELCLLLGCRDQNTRWHMDCHGSYVLGKGICVYVDMIFCDVLCVISAVSTFH